MDFYLDTNIFIYLADKKSPYNKSCSKLTKYFQKHQIRITTSTETFQEIIHYSQNTKQLSTGITIAKKVLELVDGIYSVDKTTIEIYLDQVKKYENAKSRDIIHLSVCLENGLSQILSYDKEFKQFKEVKVLTPKEFLSQNGV